MIKHLQYRPSIHTSRAWRGPLLGASVALLVTACGAGGDETVAEEQVVALGQARVQLTRAETCDGLLSSIQSSAVAMLEERVSQIREQGEDGYYGYGELGDTPTPGDIGIAVGGSDNVSRNTVGQAAPMSADPSGVPSPEQAFEEPAVRINSDGNGNEGSSESAGDSGGFSGTTVQVVDVDEADIIKTDGDRVYVLHGGTLLAVKAWPADETSIIASAVVEGEPVDMFVYEGHAVVFSRVYKNLTAESEQLGQSDESNYYGRDYTSYTKITVLEVSGDSEPGIVRESYIEGNYVSARRHDGLVRAVVQDGFKVPSLGNPNVEFRDPFGNPYEQADIDAQLDAWTARMTRSIRSTDLGDWLPREYSRDTNGVSTVSPRCANYYTPDAGLTESGVTSVVALDLDNVAAPLGGATILGRAERVYSNKDVLLLTQTDYRWRFDSELPPEQTILHRFEIDGGQTSYTASGAIAGRIHNQFSLDERNGIIRVSTTEDRWQRFEGDGSDVLVSEPSIGISTPVPVEMASVQDEAPEVGRPEPEPSANPVPEEEPTNGAVDPTVIEGRPFEALPPPPNGPVNRVITLETVGSDLVQLGSTDEFGATERIYATRFMGDRAYVVTFRRTDPLFVVDLEDDANPTVVGELHIPGFSDYLYPLGEDHLFAIGQDADSEGRVRGLALQLFDVSDATKPTLTERYVYDDFGASPANIDHRAISFHNNGKVIAFPYQNYETGLQSLEVFEISAEEETIVPVGSMNPSQEIELSECLASYGYDPAFIEEVENNADWQEEFRYQCQDRQRFRRSVFRDNFLYGIGTGGIYVYDLEDLEAAPLAVVALPALQYYDGEYEGEEGFAMTAPGGSAGIPVAPAIDVNEPAGDPKPASTDEANSNPEADPTDQ